VSVRLCWTLLEVGSLAHKTLEEPHVPSVFMTVGIISNTYCSTKCCTFTVMSTLTYIGIPTGPVGLMAHSVYLSGFILDCVVLSAKKLYVLLRYPKSNLHN